MENDSSTELARAHFFSHFAYTRNDLAGDYETELLRYRDDTWDYPKRAARLSAAVKRYKTYRMLCFIFEIAESVDLDFTPLVVKRLCTALFGRSGSQNIIVATFGQKDRIHRSRDSSPSVINEVAERYRLAAHSCWSSTLSDIESVRKHYQAGIRTARKRDE